MKSKVIICVLKTGGVYDVTYVNHLANAIKRHVTIPYRFVCLTDETSGFNANVDAVVALRDDLPGWWSKMELFNLPQYDDCDMFFLDLDTVVVGNIDHMISASNCFMALDDFYRTGQMGSGLMAWTQHNNRYIYDQFMKNPISIMKYPYGDQEWIQEATHYERFQDAYPGEVVSFKVHCRKNWGIEVPTSAKIVCFHGLPKPHEIEDNVIAENWK